jgi:ribosomal protein S18 acetylase RimI-like enzyme
MLTVGIAQEDDFPGLAAAHRRAFAVDIERFGIGPAGYGDLEWHRMIAGKLHYFAIREDGEVVGGIIVADEGEGQFFLNTLFVDPAVQGRGVGARAMAYLDVAFPEARFWHLVTPQESTNAQRLYERSGYVRVGEVTETDPRSGKGLALYRYERERAQS